jgi:hypothetical protein
MGATLFSLYYYINHKEESSTNFKVYTVHLSSLTHIFEIQEEHLKQLDIEVANNCFFYLQSLKLNLAISVSTRQNITFQTNIISDKFLSTIQDLQVKWVSPNFLQGSTVVKLYKHLQHKAQNGNTNLLILEPSDLFQIDVSYFYKSSTKELNILLHVLMVKPMKLLKNCSSLNFLYLRQWDKIIHWWQT